ncbi:hypothetical protein MYMAC_006587 [Corallococcus macrosporus DSM 14697]|uniref:Uncharacterized protein n=2 Tax=Corallococcus macrosporus TaxID=35 RepID=A0A250K4U7_9BACT|nr:hypothetical protein MYMAC_006587 [Corallococcus macrosporus DSM 14697]
MLVARNPDAFNARLAGTDAEGLAALRRGFEAAFGWAPPAEFDDWLAIEAALGIDAGEEDYWGAGDRSLLLDFFNPESHQATEALASGAFLAQNAEGLLAGLFPLSEDASGDRALASLLPDSLGLLRVHSFRHERGDLGEAQCLKSFVVNQWSSEDASEAGSPPGDVGLVRYEYLMELTAMLDMAMATERQAQPSLELPDSAQLYLRSRWLMRMVWGQPSELLSELLAQAPGLSEWDAERTLWRRHPVLTNYWMVAHSFLGNDSACAETVAVGLQASGLLTRRLAEHIRQLLAAPEDTHLGRLEPATFKELRRITRASARSDQLSV